MCLGTYPLVSFFLFRPPLWKSMEAHGTTCRKNMKSSSPEVGLEIPGLY